MPFPLRPYQREMLDAVDAAAARGIQRPLAVLPTGAGKTICFVHAIVRRGGRALILAHRDELLAQAADKVHQIAPDATIGVVKAEHDSHHADIVVASVPTLTRPNRLNRLTKNFTTVIVDEAHHATAQSYRTVLAGLGSFTPGGPLTLGVTATAGRTDNVALGHTWEEIVYQRGILQMIADGHLVDARAYAITSDLDMSHVQVRGSDYTDESLAAELEQSGAITAAAAAYVEHAADRRGIAFTPTVKTSKMLVEELNHRGVTAEHVDGSTPRDDRRGILRRLHTGETQVVSNCAVLCLDMETEILTDTGWVGPHEMSYTHRVANWEDGKIFFREPIEVVQRKRYPGESMVSLHGRTRDLRVTNTHRMLYRNKWNPGWSKAPAGELVGRHEIVLPAWGVAAPLHVEPEQPKPLTEKEQRRRITAATYVLRKQGMHPAEARVEAARRQEIRQSLRYRKPIELSLDECRMIGFWLGDGTRTELQSGGVEYTLTQSKVYPHIICWVDALLERLGLDVSRREPSSARSWPHVRWSLSRGTGFGSQQRRGIFHLEPYLDKRGSRLLWGLDEEQFQAFLEGWWYADGDHGSAENGPGDSFRIYNADHGLLSHVQAIAAARGYATTLVSNGKPRKDNHRELFQLGFRKGAEHSIGRASPKMELEESCTDEDVWCVKTHTRNIVTRRRGRVTVMGNTEGFDEPSVSCILNLRPTKSPVLYTQMIGRALRPDFSNPGKTDALVLDVTDAHELGVATIADLAGGDLPSAEPGESLLEAAERVTNNQQFIGKATIKSQTATSVNLFTTSRYRWLPGGDGTYVLSIGVELTLYLVPATAADRWDVYEQPKGQPVKRSYSGLSLEYAYGVGEELARAQGGPISKNNASWRKNQPTDGQVTLLTRFGYGPLVDQLDKGQASDLITMHIAGRTARRLVHAPTKEAAQ